MTALARSTNALEECKAHILAADVAGSQIESFLAQHVLVVMCAEMQQEVHLLISGKFDRIGSSECAAFISGASKKLLRSVMTSELSGFIGLFSTAAKEVFLARLDDRVVLQYNAAVKDRHLVAHSSGAQLTIGDLEAILSHASVVLAAVDEALSSVTR